MRFSAKILLVLAAALTTVGCQSPGSVATFQASNAMVASEPLPNSTAMPTGAPQAASPAGFASFCLRYADQCASDPSSPAAVTLDVSTVGKLEAVNRTVNRAIWPEEDEKHYGRAEYWTIPTDGYGDCDDYAVTKRAQLIAAGLPENALRLAVVVTRRDVRHAVLTIATDKGDYVLDSLNDDVLPWSKTGYQWLARQSSDNARNWLSLQIPALAPGVMTAAITAAAAAQSELHKEPGLSSNVSTAAIPSETNVR